MAARLVIRDHGHCLIVPVGKDAHIMDVWVDPEFRGKGEGKALLQAALEVAAGIGAEKAVLHTRTDNFAMQRVAEACGFSRKEEDYHYEAPIRQLPSMSVQE